MHERQNYVELGLRNLRDAFEYLTFAVEHFERAANDGLLGPKTSPILMASRRLRDDLAQIASTKGKP